jgi:hypothetical protein
VLREGEITLALGALVRHRVQALPVAEPRSHTPIADPKLDPYGMGFGASDVRDTRTLPVTSVADLPLRGAGGEPVDFARTIVSHGVAELPPNRVDLAGPVLATTLPVRGGARTVRITSRGKKLRIEGSADPKLAKTVAHMFRLDEDLSAFYALVAEDDELAWCALGAGRMLRAPTVFEDVVKTICTLIRSPSTNRGRTGLE